MTVKKKRDLITFLLIVCKELCTLKVICFIYFFNYNLIDQKGNKDTFYSA